MPLGFITTVIYPAACGKPAIPGFVIGAWKLPLAQGAGNFWNIVDATKADIKNVIKMP